MTNLELEYQRQVGFVGASEEMTPQEESKRILAKRAKGIYYQLDDEEDDFQNQVLIGPDGCEFAWLSEPEDRIWCRDLKPVVDELNRLHKELERYKEKEHNDRPWGPEDLYPQDYPSQDEEHP